MICVTPLFGIAQKTSFGFKAGVNLANITYKGDRVDHLNRDIMVAHHFGSFVELKLTDIISLQPEVIFSKQGTLTKVEGENGNDSSLEYSTKFDYLNFPITGKVYLEEGFSFEAGPQIGVLLGYEDKYKYTSGDIKIERTSGTEKVNKVDVAANTGVAYKFPFGLSLFTRYSFGLKNIFKDFPEGNTATHGVLLLSVGYSFE